MYNCHHLTQPFRLVDIKMVKKLLRHDTTSDKRPKIVNSNLNLYPWIEYLIMTSSLDIQLASYTQSYFRYIAICYVASIAMQGEKVLNLQLVIFDFKPSYCTKITLTPHRDRYSQKKEGWGEPARYFHVEAHLDLQLQLQLARFYLNFKFSTQFNSSTSSLS